jgi:hypothetical protein
MQKKETERATKYDYLFIPLNITFLPEWLLFASE